MPNAQQMRALAVLEGLLASSGDDTDATTPKKRGKKKKRKSIIKFLPSYGLALPSLYRQEQWAPDWCEGWYFRPDYAHAQALGVTLETRARVAGILHDEQGKPVQDVDKKGKPKFTKKGAPIYKKMYNYHLEWAQSSAFSFKEKDIIHTIKNEKWEIQQKNNPLSLIILKAKAAVPGTKTRQRDPGEVTFALCRREDGYKQGEQVTMTQDDFVRYLITGERV